MLIQQNKFGWNNKNLVEWSKHFCQSNNSNIVESTKTLSNWQNSFVHSTKWFLLKQKKFSWKHQTCLSIQQYKYWTPDVFVNSTIQILLNEQNYCLVNKNILSIQQKYIVEPTKCVLKEPNNFCQYNNTNIFETTNLLFNLHNNVAYLQYKSGIIVCFFSCIIELTAKLQVPKRIKTVQAVYSNNSRATARPMKARR